MRPAPRAGDGAYMQALAVRYLLTVMIRLRKSANDRSDHGDRRRPSLRGVLPSRHRARQGSTPPGPCDLGSYLPGNPATRRPPLPHVRPEVEGARLRSQQDAASYLRVQWAAWIDVEPAVRSKQGHRDREKP